jgi:hypothetical protein
MDACMWECVELLCVGLISQFAVASIMCCSAPSPFVWSLLCDVKQDIPMDSLCAHKITETSSDRTVDL